MRNAWLFLLTISVSFAGNADVFNAARNNQVAAVATFLNQQGDPNLRDEKGHPLLILAAYNGSLETVDLLLKRGANPQLQDNMGTALMAASFKGSKPVVQRLLAAGAKVGEHQRRCANAVAIVDLRSGSQKALHDWLGTFETCRHQRRAHVVLQLRICPSLQQQVNGFK